MGKKRQAKLYSPTYDEWQTQLASVLAIETGPLFVFSMVGPKQNAGSPFSGTVLNALSHGTLGFALHGSSLNHFLIDGNSSTANQILSSKWLLKLPRRAKPRVPLERA